jgi:hypothetical protein
MYLYMYSGICEGDVEEERDALRDNGWFQTRSFAPPLVVFCPFSFLVMPFLTWRARKMRHVS